MADRWPASMRTATAAEYLDISLPQFRKIADEGRIQPIQHTIRGDRYYLRSDLDAYLECLRELPVRSSKAA